MEPVSPAPCCPLHKLPFLTLHRNLPMGKDMLGFSIRTKSKRETKKENWFVLVLETDGTVAKRVLV